MHSTALNVLFICDYHIPGHNANALADHIDPIAKHSRHNIFVLSNFGELTEDFDINLFDVLVLHYSIYVVGTNYLSDALKERIRHFKGLKIQFIQDEYRTLNQFQIEIDRLGTNVLFTCVPEHLRQLAYPKHVLPDLELRSTLTGFVSSSLLAYPKPPLEQRTTDVFYRGRQVPYWLGRGAQEKHWIAAEFSERCKGTSLVVDLDSTESGRVYGEEWLKRLSHARCTLGVESTATIFDYTGLVQIRTEEYVSAHPDATFDEVEAAVFPGRDGLINTAQISPRCFEAAALKTCMVLFEGNYSGVLEPGRHYIPLKKDFSNFNDVVVQIRDDRLVSEMVERTYQEIALNPQYSSAQLVQDFDTALDERAHEFHVAATAFDRSTLAPLFASLKHHTAFHMSRVHGPLLYRQGQTAFLPTDSMIYGEQDFEHVERLATWAPPPPPPEPVKIEHPFLISTWRLLPYPIRKVMVPIAGRVKKILSLTPAQLPGSSDQPDQATELQVEVENKIAPEPEVR